MATTFRGNPPTRGTACFGRGGLMHVHLAAECSSLHLLVLYLHSLSNSKGQACFYSLCVGAAVTMEVSLWLSWSPFGHGFQIHGLGSAALTLATFLDDDNCNARASSDHTVLVHYRINFQPHTGPYWSYHHARFVTQHGSYCTFSKAGATAGYRAPAFMLRAE